jgi:hypothetical protein
LRFGYECQTRRGKDDTLDLVGNDLGLRVGVKSFSRYFDYKESDVCFKKSKISLILNDFLNFLFVTQNRKNINYMLRTLKAKNGVNFFCSECSDNINDGKLDIKISELT